MEDHSKREISHSDINTCTFIKWIQTQIS